MARPPVGKVTVPLAFSTFPAPSTILAMSAFLLPCILSGCDVGGDRHPRDKTIVLAGPFGSEFTRAAQVIAERYADQHADVIVRVVAQSRRKYDAWLENRFAEGDPPDIYVDSAGTSAGRSDRALVLDDRLDAIDPHSGLPWREAFLPGVLDQAMDARKRTAAVPGAVRGYGFYYNRGLFELARAEPPRTWTEFVQVCKKLDAAGHVPFACSGQNQPGDFAWFVWGLRGLQDMMLRHLQDQVVQYRRDPAWRMDLQDPWNDLRVRVTIEDIMLAYVRGPFNPLENPDWGRCCSLLKSLLRFYPAGFAGMTMNEAKDLFNSQSAAMIYQDTAFAHEVAYARRQQAEAGHDFEVGVFPWPALTSATVDVSHLAPPRAQVETIQRWQVARSTPQREQRAITFLRFLLEARNVEYVQSQQTAPQLPSVRGARPREALAVHGDVWLGHGMASMGWLSATFGDPDAEAGFRANMQLYLLEAIELDELMARTEAEIVPLFRRRAARQAVDTAWVVQQLRDAGEPVPAWLVELGAAPQ